MKRILSLFLAIMLLTSGICSAGMASAMVVNELDAFDTALNADGSSIDFTTDTQYPWVLCADSQGNGDAAVRSNTMGIDSSESTISFNASVQTGERLSFDVKCSTEGGYDIFYLYDNGEIVLRRSGEIDWRNEFYTVTESGEHSFTFAFCKDSGGAEGDDCVYLDNVAFIGIDPNDPTLSSVMNASGCNNVYYTEDNSWVHYIYEGRYCAKSNIESIDDGIATLYTESFIEAGASIFFDYATSTEEDFDNLYFSAINLDTGDEYMQVFEATGETAWSTGAWTAPDSANYRLIFTYEKDGSGCFMYDAVYVSNCYIPSSIVGEVVWSTSFEHNNPFYCGWTTIDADGDGYTFEWTRDIECFLYGRSISADGRANMASASYSANFDRPLSPDNYLVSPAITIYEDNSSVTLKIMARSQDEEAHIEHFQVLASNNPTDFSNADILFEGDTVHEWTSYRCDFTRYIGETIYVAIRHFNTTDMYYLNIDMFEIVADGTVEVSQSDPIYPIDEMLSNAINIDGGQLEFYSGSKAPWYVSKVGDRTVAQSSNHAPLTNGYIITNITLNAPARLSFDWMNSAEQNFDYLKLFINGEAALDLRDVLSDFTNAIVEIPEAGEYQFAWVFSKDDEINELNDACFIDNVEILDAIHPESFDAVSFMGIRADESRSIEYTLLPEDATSKHIDWSSSDETIAVVDENGVVTGCNPGRAIITGCTADGNLIDKVTITVTEPYAEQTLYGFRYIGSNPNARFDLVSFTDRNPENIASITSFPGSTHIFSAMEYVNGKLYAASGCMIYSMDFGIFEPTLIHDEIQDDFEIVDMTYDHSSDKMYLLLASNSQSAVYEMNLGTGSITLCSLVAGLSLPANTLAISADGRAYCTEAYTGKFFSIDITTGETELIGNFGFGGAKNQSMSFDLNTGRLILASYVPNVGNAECDQLYIVDTNTAICTRLGNMGGENETQLVGLFSIPENSMQSFRIDFVDGISGEIVISETIERGSIIDEFPSLNEHSGYVLLGWNYDNSPVLQNTTVYSRFALVGDIDFDHQVTVEEATTISRCALGLHSLESEALMIADASGDGAIRMDDALIVLRLALSLGM